MNRGRLRWVLRLSILPIIAIILLLWAMREQGEKSAVLVNHSGQSIARLQLTLGGKTRTFTDLASEARVTFPLKGTDSDTLMVEVKLADGALLHAPIPFSSLTKNMAGGRVLLLVLPKGQIILQTPGQKQR